MFQPSWDLSAWSLLVLPVHGWVFSGYSDFLPQSKNMLSSTAATEENLEGISHLKMRALDGVVVVIVLCLCTEALGVQVNVEGVSFPLEAVKQLKKLFNLDEKIPELTKKDVEDVCANRDLPQVFKPVCQEEGRQAVFSKLVRIPLDVCEICSFAACTGC
uniref:Guanylate cyclase activator 2B n=1 Tax=Amphiprion ocellaris TaxID=80972 RepID=A0A3Q1CGY0_AMPOC